jgi:hypothetical protein
LNTQGCLEFVTAEHRAAMRSHRYLALSA